MRTPGADEELALGFLFAEGVIERREDVLRAPALGLRRTGGCTNIIEVELADGLPEPELAGLEHFFATSACSICGKAGWTR